MLSFGSPGATSEQVCAQGAKNDTALHGTALPGTSRRGDASRNCPSFPCSASVPVCSLMTRHLRSPTTSRIGPALPKPDARGSPSSTRAVRTSTGIARSWSLPSPAHRDRRSVYRGQARVFDWVLPRARIGEMAKCCLRVHLRSIRGTSTTDIRLTAVGQPARQLMTDVVTSRPTDCGEPPCATLRFDRPGPGVCVRKPSRR